MSKWGSRAWYHNGALWRQFISQLQCRGKPLCYAERNTSPPAPLYGILFTPDFHQLSFTHILLPKHLSSLPVSPVCYLLDFQFRTARKIVTSNMMTDMEGLFEYNMPDVHKRFRLRRELSGLKWLPGKHKGPGWIPGTSCLADPKCDGTRLWSHCWEGWDRKITRSLNCIVRCYTK